jgi:SPASM domain peptide maturase of grasp-with-spasm system
MGGDYFVLYANCIPIRGSFQSCIIDLQRHEVHTIPNDLCNVLMECPTLKIKDIPTLYPKDINILKEYYDFLEKKELVFKTKYPKRFPRLNKLWDYPSHVTNAIIEFNPFLHNDYKLKIKEFDDLLCNYLEVRIYDWNENVKDELSKFIEVFEGSTIHSISIKISGFDDLEYLSNLIDKYPRVCSIEVYGTKKPASKYIKTYSYLIHKHACGVIDIKYFSPNITNFTESLHHNSCLNRKISIDIDGEIRNCPSMPESFGNIKDTTLMEAIEKPGFKKYWDINKDKIHVCKDCEFRYVCTDCRAYVEDPEDILSKPLKCGYNPYTGEWSEWSTNPLKQKAIDFYGMREMVNSQENSA